MSFLRMQESPKSLIIWGFRTKRPKGVPVVPGKTVSTNLRLLILPKDVYPPETDVLHFP